jgi:hypothetical protein
LGPTSATTQHPPSPRRLPVLKKLQALAAPGTIGDKPFVFDYPGSDEATWRIHKTFELPKTLADACTADAS